MNRKINSSHKIFDTNTLIIYGIINTLTLIIYLINFTTFGIELGFNVKPSVLLKKDNSYQYQLLCNDDTRPTEYYKCRTNKKILNNMSSMNTGILKKDRYLKYFTNVSYISIKGGNIGFLKEDIEKKLKYLNPNKITHLYIDKYNGEDLDFVLKLKNLETLIIIDAKNLGNYDKIVGMKKLGYIDINDEVIKND